MLDDVTRALVKLALAEDLGVSGVGLEEEPHAWLSRDVTAVATIDAGAVATAVVTAKSSLVVSGTGVCEYVDKLRDATVRVTWHKRDGESAIRGERVCTVEGSTRVLLTGERTFLNFLGHLSGIATMAHAAAMRVAGTRAKVLDTRKTMPGMRALEKAAVVHGGCYNHRVGLYDAFLVKENHIAAAGGVAEAMGAARRLDAGLSLIVEVETLGQLREALGVSPAADVVLLDNFTVGAMREAVGVGDARGAGVLLEVSGGVTLETLGEIAATGVDRISMGALTHSAVQADVSIRLQ